MNVPLSPCAPENLVSREGFSRPLPRQSAHLHTQAESGAYLRDSSHVFARGKFSKSSTILVQIAHANKQERFFYRRCSRMVVMASCDVQILILFVEDKINYCLYAGTVHTNQTTTYCLFQ